MSLAQRSITSISWNMVANVAKVVILFARTVILARLLPIETFGVYALAGSVVGLSIPLATFGLGGAFLHRTPETEDESHAAGVHLTLKGVFTLLWAVLVTAGALIFTDGAERTAIISLTLIFSVMEMAQTPRLILTRRVIHRRLALLDMLNAVFTTIIAIGLAWQGVTLWALLATDFVTMCLTIGLLYLWRPVWKPRFVWKAETVRYYLSFGSRNFLGNILLQALNRIDDLWAGLFLGRTPLGFYSRAYTFATYPRRILATPVNQVVTGTYAELKNDRVRLSKAFFRINALLIRSGFFLAGLLSLIAPEFIHLFLGDKWLPMLIPFRLMLIFTLLDPIKISVASMFLAVGKPEQIVRVRLIQLVVMVIGLFTLGRWFGIVGVAVAVDVMLAAGIGLMLWLVRVYVDYSVIKLFAAPGIALAVGLALGLGILELSGLSGSYWMIALVKFIAFPAGYVLVELVAERTELIETTQFVRKQSRAS